MTKADLWRLWQDSERQLRSRLRQAEAQRDDLIRRLSRLASQDRQGNVSESLIVPEEICSREGRSPLGHSEEDITKKRTIQEGETILHSVAERHGEDERVNIRCMRLTEHNTRLRPSDEVRKKNNKGVDISFTPKGRKRHRIKQKDSPEPLRNVDTDDHLTQHRYANRGTYTDGVKRSNSSEDLDATLRRRIRSGRVIDNLGEREIPEGFSGYSTTPLPLLHSLHQHTRTERSYGPVQLSQLDTREHRTFQESAHFEQTSGNEILEKDAIILKDDNIYKDISHPRGREEGSGPRRRRITSHPMTNYSESHPRRWPKDRHSARDQSEGRGKREQEREARYTSVRKSREKDGRDTSGTFSGMSSNSRKQHGVRIRPSYESSSEYEEVRLRPGTSTSTEITQNKRESMQKFMLRGYETLQRSNELSSEKSVLETRETMDPP